MPGAHRADIEAYGCELAEHLLSALGHRPADISAHQFLWGHYMLTGDRRFGDAVIQSLRAICRSAHVETSLAGNARQLELLTWVWRVERCPDLRRRMEEIAALAVTRMRAPGFGFTATAGNDERGRSVRPGWNGLMLVALIEVGSVFERREWLALAREVFDEVVGRLADAGEPSHAIADGCGRAAADLDDFSMMSRAATRLFEAFGKRRYLDHAENWVAPLDATFRDAGGGDRTSQGDARPPALQAHITDGALQSNSALMIGLLARLHALTGRQGYAERAERLLEALSPVRTRAGIADATTIANARTAARLVSIDISGDPKLPETRELMRIALDCGIPDRLVLGPGAGRAPGERPLAQIRVGLHRLAPIDDPATLRTIVAPGGLAAVFFRQDTRVTVDSGSNRWVT